MRLPRWFLRLFPRFAPQGAWADAVRVTDPRAIAHLHVLYAEQVAWCRTHGFPILAPDCRVTLRYWPEHLRAPDGFGTGKVLTNDVIPEDTYGTLLVRKRSLGKDWLIRHEVRHAITGISDHPKELFPDG